MIASAMGAIALNEVRIRARRFSTLVTLLAIVCISWLMVPDPATGMTMMAINDARVIYDSQCLAIAGSTLMSLLLSLAGFYLVRGRMRDDLVFGVSAALASAPITNTQFLLGRWLGACAYLCSMAVLCMASLLVLHAVRGESTIVLHIYLEHFVLILIPQIMFVSSMSILFDAWSLLMGKFGDVLYFVVWVMLVALTGNIGNQLGSHLPLALWGDFSGLGSVLYGLHHLVHTTRISIGVASFDPSLPPVVIAGEFWSPQLALTRLVSALVALLPVLAALLLFHRFSPDRVSSRMLRSRRSLFGLFNGLVAPVAMLARPGYRMAMAAPGFAGGLLADSALLLTCNPISIPALMLALLAGTFAPADLLSGVLSVAVAFWGILISDSAVRDFAAGIEPMTAYLPGGPTRRYLRQLLSGWLFGLLMVLPIALRWAAFESLRCAALVTGLFAFAAAANLLGRVTHTARTFTALFLFAVYVSAQMDQVPAFDPLGLHGVATIDSVLAFGLIGSAVAYLGLLLAAYRSYCLK